eukprot:GHVL01031349.1.p1 GENE.GHVL01031349.1~~GHVL01031349.1.p1  ORF type:complete len:242 (+),score=76.76 GHVL01031349.1:202-927(+)
MTLEIIKPVIICTYAFMLSENEKRKRFDKATHHWICLLRSPNGEDLSYFIKKVVFKLHDSFTEPVRICETAPFQIEECGWGEFEIGLTVTFVESSEKSVEIYHPLRLYPSLATAPGGSQAAAHVSASAGSNRPVAHETYDEIVISNPRPEFYNMVMNGPPKVPPPPHQLQNCFGTFDEADELKPLYEASSIIQCHIAQLKNQLTTLCTDYRQLMQANTPSLDQITPGGGEQITPGGGEFVK